MRATNLPSVCIAVVFALAYPVAEAATNAWTRLPDCRLAKNLSNDGDSFYVRHEDTVHLFRLYFVDCPETSRLIPSRVRSQADYWGIGETAVLQRGKAAASFTTRALKKPFTVHTRWQDARGKSRTKRHFAFVRTHAGKDLAAELVRAGLARTYGASVPHPDGTSTRQMWKRLDALEEEAEEAGRGCWSK